MGPETTPSPIAAITARRGALAAHPVFDTLGTLPGLRRFMAHHVFAVWDFMLLLKTLQARLTGGADPWLPPADAEAAWLINEIVLGEESDRLPDGRVSSHFDLYRIAMVEVGVSTGPIDALIEVLRAGGGLETALAWAPPAARRFVRTTAELCRGSTPAVAGAFLFGRETLIPPMFETALARSAEAGIDAPAFELYLARHVEVDGEHHGPMAEALLERLCADDARRAEAHAAARAALEAREALWDAVTDRR